MRSIRSFSDDGAPSRQHNVSVSELRATSRSLKELLAQVERAIDERRAERQRQLQDREQLEVERAEVQSELDDVRYQLEELNATHEELWHKQQTSSTFGFLSCCGPPPPRSPLRVVDSPSPHRDLRDTPACRLCRQASERLRINFPGHTCDECHAPAPVGATMYSCRQCNRDFCEACMNDAHGHGG
mmetsp:Transcript_50358/g.130780  ORF Transcript_50358/g.130780 Transcript_50358/m.130780 type:complete len:186 (+) Transcript_50358:39-596(+)